MRKEKKPGRYHVDSYTLWLEQDRIQIHKRDGVLVGVGCRIEACIYIYIYLYMYRLLLQHIEKYILSMSV